MKVNELITILKRLPQGKNIEVFAKGEIYKKIEVTYLKEDNVVEIGCGWDSEE